MIVKEYNLFRSNPSTVQPEVDLGVCNKMWTDKSTIPESLYGSAVAS